MSFNTQDRYRQKQTTRRGMKQVQLWVPEQHVDSFKRTAATLRKMAKADEVSISVTELKPSRP